MNWPNNPEWSALKKKTVSTSDGDYVLSLIDCGVLKVPSGKLVCCDPFAAMRKSKNSYIQIPAGKYKVVVTLADVSSEHDGSHYREAYASLILNENADETIRRFFHPTDQGHSESKDLKDGHFIGFGVDAGTACFVDQESIEEGMPPEDVWYEGLFENEQEGCWFNLMDDEKNIRGGIANIVLPESKCENNLILFHSGWGDGVYPIIGGYDKSDNLVAVHIDFMVVSDADDISEPEKMVVKKKWWKFW